VSPEIAVALIGIIDIDRLLLPYEEVSYFPD
jgi:hypothetical protein